MRRTHVPGIFGRSDVFQNDRIFISHRHDPEDGFPNLEDMGDGYMSDDLVSGTSSMQMSEQKPLGGSRSTRYVAPEVGKRSCYGGDVLTPYR